MHREMYEDHEESGISFDVVEAVDINPTTNTVYRHNFPECNLIERQIQNLSAEHLDSLQLDMILMSPPCQPFTRFGNKKDTEDDRTTSFLHILKILPLLKQKPKYILLENVKGFEVSQSRELLLSTLDKLEYVFQEFLISPLQVGVPNSRLRYYLIAKLKPLQFDFKKSDQIMESIPSCAEEWLLHKKNISGKCSSCSTEEEQQSNDSCNSSRTVNHIQASDQSPTEYSGADNPHSICELCHNSPDTVTVGQNLRQTETAEGTSVCFCERLDKYLQHDMTEDTCKQFLVPEKEFRWFCVMEIVLESVRKTSCFTKRYGHFVNGAGSVLFTSNNIEDLCAASKLKEEAELKKNREDWGEKEMQIIRNLKLRYFTPREIANLLCFPAEFNFIISQPSYLAGTMTLIDESGDEPRKVAALSSDNHTLLDNVDGFIVCHNL